MVQRRNPVIYQINLRTFTLDGTLQAAERMLPHIATLCVDYVYLCPIFLADDDEDQELWSERQKKSGMQNPKNPYRMKDYFTIDPEYGTNADLHTFVQAAHRLGLKVMLDLVYAHCGPNCVHIQQYPDFVQRDADGNILFTEWHFPKINFTSENTVRLLTENMLYFVREFGIDGYRCDVGDMVPLDFWKQAITEVKKLRPDFFMLNEGRDPDYLSMFDLNYSFDFAQPLQDVLHNRNTVQKFCDWQRYIRQERYAGDGMCMNCLENHDISNDDYEERIDRIQTEMTDGAYVVLYTIDGAPMLYNGNELADSRRHSMWGNRFYGKNLVVDWANAVTERGKTRLALIRRLGELKHTVPALAYGATEWETGYESSSVIAFYRKAKNSTVFVAVNFGEQAVTISLPEKKTTQLLLHNTDVSQMEAVVGKYGYAVLECCD